MVNIKDWKTQCGWEHGFKFQHYEECVAKALKNGYKFMTHLEYSRAKKDNRSFDKVILLRHDIDGSIEKAIKMFELEKKLGVKSTFFFRVHAYYNLFDYKSYKFLKELEKNGFEVGLHTEVVNFSHANNLQRDDILKKEKLIFDKVLGIKISGVAPHRDFTFSANSLPYLREADLEKLGFEYQSYHPMFVEEMEYVAETFTPHLTWHTGCFCEHLKKGTKGMVVATHPQWWYDSHPFNIIR